MQVKDGGAGVKRWRKQRHLTQRELGFLASCSQNAIHLIETGQMTTLSEDLAFTIATRLDVPWEDLFLPRRDAGPRRVASVEDTTHRSRKVPA